MKPSQFAKIKLSRRDAFPREGLTELGTSRNFVKFFPSSCAGNSLFPRASAVGGLRRRKMDVFFDVTDQQFEWGREAVAVVSNVALRVSASVASWTEAPEISEPLTVISR